MSKAEAARLYELVIDDVINDSRQDFEECAIDESTLQDLKRIWCEKLSATHVAKFPWDNQDFNNQYDPNVIISHDLLPEELTRGASLQLGEELESPISGGDSQLSYNTVQQSVSHDNDIQIPNITSQSRSEYDNFEETNSELILPQINQSDGTFEFTMYTLNGPEIMSQFNGKNIPQADGVKDEDDDDKSDALRDSDDINSELDEGLDSDKSDDDEDQEGQIMLCLYEKVQRVKNKWKSTLKEGIANINGKDYVFQKATGENEW